MAKLVTDMAEMETALKALILQGDHHVFQRIKSTIRTTPSDCATPTPQCLMLEGKFLAATTNILADIGSALVVPDAQSKWQDLQEGLKQWQIAAPMEK